MSKVVEQYRIVVKRVKMGERWSTAGLCKRGRDQGPGAIWSNGEYLCLRNEEENCKKKKKKKP